MDADTATDLAFLNRVDHRFYQINAEAQLGLFQSSTLGIGSAYRPPGHGIHTQGLGLDLHFLQTPTQQGRMTLDWFSDPTATTVIKNTRGMATDTRGYYSLDAYLNSNFARGVSLAPTREGGTPTAIRRFEDWLAGNQEVSQILGPWRFGQREEVRTPTGVQRQIVFRPSDLEDISRLTEQRAIQDAINRNRQRIEHRNHEHITLRPRRWEDGRWRYLTP